MRMLAFCAALLLAGGAAETAWGAQEPQPNKPAAGRPAQAGALWRTRTVVKRDQGGIFALAFSADGQTLASGSGKFSDRWTGEATLWNTATGKERLTVTGHSGCIWALALSRGGSTLATGCILADDDGAIRLWDTTTGKAKPALTSRDHAGITGLAFAPDGRTLASSSRGGTVKLWDWPTRKERLTLTIGDVVYALAFAPDGKSLALGLGSGRVELWDTLNGNRLHSFAAHASWVVSVAFSADGKNLASASEGDPLIKLWEPATAKERITLRGHHKPVYCVTFAPVGKTLASGSADKTIKLWDVATGKEQATLMGHSKGVRALAFAPQGKLLASASGERDVGAAGELILWDKERIEKDGNEAAELLERGRELGDWRLLSEVMTRYPHTPAGLEATALLADYHQSRGQYLRAAVCFKQLLHISGPEKLAPLTLFKAALALRASGDADLLNAAWKTLERKVGTKGLTVGESVRSLDDLKKELESLASSGHLEQRLHACRGRAADLPRVAPATFEVSVAQPEPRGAVKDDAGQKAAELLEQDRELGDWGRWSTYRGNPQRTGALDGQPGPAAPKVLWVHKTKDHFIASPVIAGDRLLVSGLGPFNVGYLFCLSADVAPKQRVLWTKTTPLLRRPTVSSPALDKGRIVFGDGMHQTDGATLHCVDIASGLPLWQHFAPGNLVHLEGSPTLAGGRAYTGGGAAGVLCVELDKVTFEGKATDVAGVQKILAERWKELQAKYDQEKKKDPMFAVPPTEDQLPRANPMRVWQVGQQKWHVDAPVAVMAGKVLVASSFLDQEKVGDRALYCLDASTGKELWRTPLKLNPWGGPSLEGTTVVVSGSSIGYDPKALKGAKGFVAAFDLDGGKEKWTKEVTGGVVACAAIADGAAIVSATDGKVRAFELTTGEPRWIYDAKAPLFAPVAVAKDVVYAGDLKGVVHAIDLKAGMAKWQLDLGCHAGVQPPGMIYGGPIVEKGRLYVATCNLEGASAGRATVVLCIGER